MQNPFLMFLAKVDQSEWVICVSLKCGTVSWFLVTRAPYTTFFECRHEQRNLSWQLQINPTNFFTRKRKNSKDLCLTEPVADGILWQKNIPFPIPVVKNYEKVANMKDFFYISKARYFSVIKPVISQKIEHILSVWSRHLT